MSSRSALTGALRRSRALIVVCVPLLGLSPIAMALGFFAGGETRSGSDSVAGQAAPAKVSLQLGATINVRLDVEVSTQTSHLLAPISARVVREVSVPEGVAIPLGVEVRGRIEKLIPSSTPTDRARIMLRFSRLEIPGEPSAPIQARVAQVENARETVLPNGMIQGVLASELPVSFIQKAAKKLGKSGSPAGEQAQQAQQSMLGKPDTSIVYPAGADLELVLEKPLELDRVFVSSTPGPPSPDDLASMERAIEERPARASSKDGKPGDPLNLVIIGSESEIRQAFEKAGWAEPEKASGKSVWEATRAIIGDVGYGKAPVSDLYLMGEKETLAFAKMLNTVAKRHHLRLWRTRAATSSGQEIWVGASTHDTGYDIRPGVISHAIDSDIDAERTKVGADLIVTGCVERLQLLTRSNPLTEGLTATGAEWKTDGRLLAMELKPGGGC